MANAELPRWKTGTPAVLCVDGPHAIPVSTAVRASGDRVLFALGRERETLRRLRRDPRAALCLLGEGVALTAHGRARIVGELESAGTVVAVELSVALVQDHLLDGRTQMLDGARWRWLDERAAAAESSVVAELQRLKWRRRALDSSLIPPRGRTAAREGMRRRGSPRPGASLNPS